MSSLLLVPKDLLRIIIEYIARFNMVSIYGITVYPLDWFLTRVFNYDLCPDYYGN